MLVSHSQDFLNGVCTNIIHLFKRGLFYYGVSERKRGKEGGREGGKERGREGGKGILYSKDYVYINFYNYF